MIIYNLFALYGASKLLFLLFDYLMFSISYSWNFLEYVKFKEDEFQAKYRMYFDLLMFKI